MKVDRTIPNDGSCDNTNCDEGTEWDQIAIRFGTNCFCSPDCARNHLKSIDEAPESLTLHDPQASIPRDKFDESVGEFDIDIDYNVDSIKDAKTTVDEIEAQVHHTFR